jgi:hypothetical protein
VQKRWTETSAQEKRLALGVDVADGGADQTVTVRRHAPDAALAAEDARRKEDQGSEALRSPAPSDSLTLSSSSVMQPGRSREGSKSRHRKQTYWQSVASIGVQVADALGYARKQGVQHRDTKPSNLLGLPRVPDAAAAPPEDE